MNPADSPSASPSGTSRPLTLAAICFVVGAALAGGWFYHQNKTAGPGLGGLSEQTQNLLEHLEAPVTIRFYALLPAGSARAEQQAFAGRVDQLITAVQQVGGGKIQATRFDAVEDASLAAASADGLQPFNLDQGEACFLGLSISSGSHKETIARLQPEWESALPYDLVRAILRVAATQAPAPLPRAVAQPRAEIINSIKTLIPDLQAVSLEEADQIFHAEFIKECAVAGTELEVQIGAAQNQVVQAQAGGSPEELAAAQKNLQKVQLEQADKLKQVAADLQTRLAVFHQMKTTGTKPGK